ncbi:MAG TPA: TonB-dependent receptor, partial [Agriterribacter sp.]|nr:TonB-dependent receptor [Agriterribacter sp.]
MERIRLFIIVFSLLHAIPSLVIAQARIHGTVTDMNSIPLPDATVLLLQPADSALVKGTVTNSTGGYLFENIATGNYLISFSHTGFSPHYSTLFHVAADVKNVENGTQQLERSGSTLTGVTITAKRPLYEQKPDRLTINVANSITSAGNTALQILERSPGVIVNRQSNTIAMLGKEGVRVMINGKLNYMPVSAVLQMLDGMSAGNIDRIELITTPPANFDAEGNAGYINIILKENNNLG